MEVVILGKSIGQAEGWDQTSDTELFFYSCDTGGVYPYLDGDFAFDFQSGKFLKYNDDDGTVISEMSVFDVLTK